MTESTKWPKHIEACIKAYLELGPNVRFHCAKYHNIHFSYVINNQELPWEVSPLPKSDIEQWGNEYNRYVQLVVPGDSLTSWYDSFDICVTNRRSSVCLAMHHRVIDGETGRIKLFETLKVFESKAMLSSGSDDK